MAVLNALATVGPTLRHWFREGVFQRIFKNAGIMLSGRAATGVISVGVLSLSARSLGTEGVGMLVLVQTYVQIITTIATLQSVQGLLRFGAINIKNNDKPAFQALMKFSTLLDLGGGLVGVGIGIVVAPLVGPHLGWSPEVIGYAQAYSGLILFTACATPTALMRLFDRFDVLAMQTVVTPLFRLIGIGIAVVLDAPFWAYLMAWFVAQVAGGLSLTYIGWREANRRGWLSGFTFSLRGIMDHHNGLVRFAVQSNIYMSLQVLSNQASVLFVGFLAGPSAAGIFKIARDASTFLSRPAELLNNSIAPEFARLGSHGDWSAFSRLILRGAAIAAGAGTVMLFLTMVIGPHLLGAFFGDAFTAAYVPMVLLVAAAGVAIIGFPLDPALFAMGQAGIPLRVSTTVIFLVQLPLLLVLTQTFGPTGAAGATLIASVATLLAMTMLTATQLRHSTRAE